MFLVKGYHDVNYQWRYLIIVIISYETVMKMKKNVWNICFVLYCLFVAKMQVWASISILSDKQQCLFADNLIHSYWMQSPTWLWISNNTCLPVCPYWMSSTMWLWISNNTCLPICPYWMPSTTWLWISNNTCLLICPYWMPSTTWLWISNNTCLPIHPIGCSLPRDLLISNFCCYQKRFLLCVISNNR